MAPIDPIRILQVSARSDEGGGPRQALTLTAGLAGTHQIFAALPQGGVYWNRFEEVLGNDRLFHIDQRSSNPQHAARLARFVQQQRIELIHTHGQAAGLVGRLASLISQVPAVHTYHGLHFEADPSRRFRSAIRNTERLMSLQTRATIAVSSSEAKLLADRRLNLGSGALFTIPNGVDVPPPPSPDDLRHRAPRYGQLRVCLVLRANHQKYPEAALEILQGLHNHDVLESFEVACPLVDRNQLLLHIKALGLESKLDSIGPRDSCLPMFARNHLFLSASRWEGLPLSAVEAMAHATPIAVSGVMGHVDLYDPTRPLGCQLFRLEARERADEELLDLTHSALWVEAARQAHANAERRFNVDDMINRTNQVYHHAMEARP